MTKEDIINQKRLQAAIRLLKSKQIVTFDYEIADALDYKRPTLSQYASGAKAITTNFITRFEKKFKIDFTKIDITGKGNDELVNTEVKIMRLLTLIAKKVGIPDVEIKKALK